MAVELTILTLNIWGIPYISKDRHVRVNAIGQELAQGLYDIVALQEVWSEHDYHILKQFTSEVLPYTHYFYSGVVGSGLCVFSKFPILSTFFHAWSVNGYVHKIEHGDWFGGKGVGFCRIAVGDVVVHFYTAHLHAEYDRASDIYMTHRIIQAYSTAQFIENTSGESTIQILAGDLNTEPGDLAYSLLMSRAKLTDACVDTLENAEGTNDSAFNTYTPTNLHIINPNGKRIDYIMYRFGRNVKGEIMEYKLPLPKLIPQMEISFSDHEAVLCRIKLTPDLNKTSNELPYDQTSLCMKSLLQGIVSCNDSLKILTYNRKYYTTAAFTVLALLISIIELKSGYGTNSFFLIFKVVVCGIFFFLIFMASIWNTIERNSIYAAKLSMELELKHIEDKLSQNP